MKRNWDMNEVSDGKRYHANDMVKLGCQECAGCSACCHDMGTSIVLDPYDVYQMSAGLQWNFEQMLANCLELNVVDGLILPNLKMAEEINQCTFLNEEGRCSIHKARPGICRLFPLGRIYEGDGFDYFLQVHECKKQNRTKVKISKWLGIPQLGQYENYICQWHSLTKAVQKKIQACQDEKEIRQWNLQILNEFFVKPYDIEKDFYTQFSERLQQIKYI